MKGFVDHYILSSGEEALKLSEKEMSKAYKLKALNLHPDDPKWTVFSLIRRECYTAGRLREMFGGVEDVVVRSTKKKCSALIVMATKDEAVRVAVTRTLCGDLSNPLLVVPLQRAQTDFVTARKSAEAEPQRNIVGDGYQAYENDVMERLKKVQSGRPSQPRRTRFKRTSKVISIILKKIHNVIYFIQVWVKQEVLWHEMRPCEHVFPLSSVLGSEHVDTYYT
ncbi:hypothetical protein YC2023_025868 [Brassica napus]